MNEQRPIDWENENFLGSDEDYDPMNDPDWCPRCQGEGRVPTEDFESYLRAMYKTCPECHGKPGDGPLS
jgi:DnaJ-class molecular chaperone